MSNQEWQPIETAPKGRKAVMVYRADTKCPYGATWDDITNEWRHFGGSSYPVGGKITHWMPLPEPPTEDTNETAMSNEQPNIEKLKWDLDKAHAELGKAIDTLRDIYYYGGSMRGKWAQEKTERTLAELGKDVQHDNETPSERW